MIGDRDKEASYRPADSETDFAVQLLHGVRFGSHDSKDHDVVYAIERLPSIQQSKILCLDKTENRNLVVVRNGVVAECFKGLPDETNNALHQTYALHPQQHPNFVSRSVVRIAPLKVVRATRVILSLVAKTVYRTEVKEALASLNLARRLEVLEKIDFSHLDLCRDTLKSIAFQLGQTNSLIEGHELYTKQLIQDYAPELAAFIARCDSPKQAINDARDKLISKVSGVYVRQKGNLNLLMYGNALAIKEWNVYARQCRGMIIDLAKERCVSFPMDKFFRFGEGPEISRESLPPDEAVEIVEKVDGSMVSLVSHDGTYQFCCKGNFDTPQSERAMQIAKRLPIHQLQTDRFFHVFEVIYPENRFPHGLSIVDYKDREDLVLTSMRDRLTNLMLPYAEVVAEAKRVGLSHPKVFEGGLSDVFREVDSTAPSLHEEGYIIRLHRDGKLFKLKYSGYKEVLRMVNEMRTNRFLREHLALNREEREKSLQLLPADILAVALEQLKQLKILCTRLLEYAAAVVSVGPADKKGFADFVSKTVTKDFQSIVFQYHSRSAEEVDTRMLEKTALKIYYSELVFPETN